MEVFSYNGLNKGYVPDGNHVTTKHHRLIKSILEIDKNENNNLIKFNEDEGDTFRYKPFTRQYLITGPDRFMPYSMYRIETYKYSNDCHIEFFFHEDKILLSSIKCEKKGRGDGRRMILDLINFFNTNMGYQNGYKIVLMADARMAFKSFAGNDELQDKLVKYYKKLGFHLTDDNYEEIDDNSSVIMPQPMISTIGEIKAAIENYDINYGRDDGSTVYGSRKKPKIGGKAKSKRNKSRRRCVLKKSRRQIKKRN